MAKGEQRFSGAGREVQHFNNTPVPEDDYGLVLLEDGLGVKKSEEKGPDAIPYINARFTAQGTAAKEGQKDRMLFHMFFLSLKPGSDGVVMPDRGGQLVEFYRARGAELDAPIITKTLEDGSTVDYLDPEPILEQLKEWTDTVTDAHVVIEKDRDQKDKNGKVIRKANPNDPGRNKIQKFMVTEVEEAAKAPVKTTTPGNLKAKKK